MIIILEDDDMTNPRVRGAAEDVSITNYNIGGTQKVFMARYIIHVPHRGEAKVVKSRSGHVGIAGILPEDIAEKFKKLIALDAMERL